MYHLELREITPEMVEKVAGWLAEPENYRWLDFGSGAKPLHPASLRVMLQRDIHCIRAVVDAEVGRPIGVVALSNITPEARSAVLWYVLGEKAYAGRGYLSGGVAAMLSVAFEQLRLNSVTAWCAATNGASRRILEKNGFQPMGRQRACHPLGDELDDRLWYDMLPHDYEAAKRRSATLLQHAVA